MFNRSLISERLSIISNAANRLSLLAKMPHEQFCNNEDAIDIAENRLRRALEALFDLGRHLVVKSGVGVPKDYRSIIDMLEQAQVIPDEFANNITGMAGYRNRLIHEYNKVTPDELYEIITTKLPDFNIFCQYVVRYLQK